tara:strand:- start:1322 stop:1702 length:381 start_codon:yes stop_codon:yes gene_type:complete
MRKITQDAIAAFENGEDFQRGNTKVRIHRSPNQMIWGNQKVLLLHGNLIAKDEMMDGFCITLSGWNTPTTRERLNGFKDVDIKMKKGILYLNGKEWDGKLAQIRKGTVNVSEDRCYWSTKDGWGKR